MLNMNTRPGRSPEEVAILFTFMSGGLNGGPAPEAAAIFKVPNGPEVDAVLAGNPCLCRYDRGNHLIVGMDARHRQAWEAAFKAANIPFEVNTIKWAKA